MRLLLDTHTFVWMGHDPSMLGASARQRLLDTESRGLLSVASVWELAIKVGLGKLELDGGLDAFVRAGLAQPRIELLAIAVEHALRVERLPTHHRDPFDRLLVAQALVEQVPIVSRDASLDPYGVARIWE